MKKPNLIIGKKQIILSCLTLMLAIAVYVNYVLSDQSLADPSVSTNAPVVGQQAEEQSGNYPVCQWQQHRRLLCPGTTGKADQPG